MELPNRYSSASTVEADHAGFAIALVLNEVTVTQCAAWSIVCSVGTRELMGPCYARIAETCSFRRGIEW
jgi:hypothetical protein